MLEYKIYDDGYEILKDGKVWITQRGKYASNGDYEEEAKKEIERLQNMKQQELDETTEITDLQLAVAEIYEMIEGGK